MASNAQPLAHGANSEEALLKRSGLILAGFFLAFFAVAWPDLSEPFTSAHYVRQNHTFDINQRVFHEGWPAVLTPKMSFSLLENPQDPFTVARMDFPFHGLVGWTWAIWFPGQEREIVRLVSMAATAFSVGLFFWILRFWHTEAVALIICAIWLFSPLLLHLGQIPMPDIFATTFMMAAFAFSLRGRLLWSALFFLLALLAKVSVIVYGLPILAGLLSAKQPQRILPLFRLSIQWGLIPLVGLAFWICLGQYDPPASWQIIGGVPCGERGPIRLEDLLSLRMYVSPLVMLFAFGCGVLGTACLWASFGRLRQIPGRSLVGCTLAAIVAQYLLMRITWLEFQYTLPVLFWVLWVASFGVDPILRKIREHSGFKAACLMATVFHVALILVCATYLKKSRVSNIQAIEAAQKYLPDNSRIIVFASVRGTTTSPPVWLKRNTLSLRELALPGAPWNEAELSLQIEKLRPAGFNYLAVFDVDAAKSVWPLARSPVFETNYALAGSEIRQFCESRFQLIYEGDRMALYSLK